jgi:hypothetical protein
MPSRSRASAAAEPLHDLDRPRDERGVRRQLADERAADARRDVHDRVDPARADQLDRLAEQRRVARRMARRGLPRVQVDDRGAGPGGRDRGLRDLRGRHGPPGMPARRVAAARDGAGDERRERHPAAAAR